MSRRRQYACLLPLPAHGHAGGGIILEILYLCTLGIKLLWSIKCDVCLAIVEQLLHIPLIYITALALTVWSMVSSEAYTFIELYAQPAERLYYVLLCISNKTVRVGILNTEYEIATMLACKEIIIQSGTYAANMQRPCRAWCKTHPNLSIRHLYTKKK